MKLTPLDIHHKEFGHALRGYNEEQVDRFLDEVADEFERLFKENISLSEKLEALQAKVTEFEGQRQTINNTLMAAQRSADDIAVKANSEAADVVRDAEQKAKELIHNALAKKQQIAGELVRVKQTEEEFRAKFRSLLEATLRSVSEIALPDDVDVLLGETDEGVLGDVAVRPAAPAQAPMAAPSRPQAPVAAKPEAPAPAPRPSAPTPQPPAPGFVQAVALGEIDGPELPDEITFVDPAEFPMPTMNALGDREDDVDIEEID